MKQKFKELSEAFEELETSVSHRDYFFKDKVNALVMELLGWSQVNKDNLDQIVKNYAAKIAGQFYHLEHTGSLDKEFSKVWEVIGEVADGDFEIHRKEDSAVRQRVWDLTNGKCTYCKVELVDGGVGRDSFVVEHVVPKSAGGPDRIENYVPSCAACNIKKSNRHVIDAMGDQALPALKLVQGESS